MGYLKLTSQPSDQARPSGYEMFLSVDGVRALFLVQVWRCVCNMMFSLNLSPFTTPTSWICSQERYDTYKHTYTCSNSLYVQQFSQNLLLQYASISAYCT